MAVRGLFLSGVVSIKSLSSFVLLYGGKDAPFPLPIYDSLPAYYPRNPHHRTTLTVKI